MSDAHAGADRGSKRFVCIGCPIGCPLQLTHEGTEIVEIHGYECNRGAKYAKQEFVDPRRELATTVAIRGARWARLPVKVSGAVPKERVLEAARAIHEVVVEAPVKIGQVLRHDLLGEEGLDVVATRSMKRENPAPCSRSLIRYAQVDQCARTCGAKAVGRLMLVCWPSRLPSAPVVACLARGRETGGR